MRKKSGMPCPYSRFSRFSFVSLYPKHNMDTTEKNEEIDKRSTIWW